MRARLLDIALAVALAAIWAAVFARAASGLTGTDLGALYLAARFAAAGEWAEVYAHDPTEFFSAGSAAWAALATEVGVEGAGALYPYVYPPIWAAILAPMAQAVPWPAFKSAGLFAELLAIGLAPMAVRRLFGGRASRVAWTAGGLALLSVTQPFLIGWTQAQPQLPVTALVLFALAWERRGTTATAAALAGAALGLAAALKLTPAALALWWLATGRLRAIPAFLLVGGGLGAAQLAWLDLGLTWTYLERLGQISALVIETPVNHALDHVLTILSRGAESGPGTTSTEPLWITLATRGALALGAVALWLAWRGADPERRDVAGALGIWALTTLCGPLAWSHHLTPAALALMGLPLLIGPRAGLASAAAIWALFAAPVLAPAFGLDRATSAWALCGFAAAVCLLAASAAALRPRRDAGPDLALRPPRAGL